MPKIVWSILWLLILLIFAFWIAGFIAFFYIILYPITVCIPDLSVSKVIFCSIMFNLNRLFLIDSFQAVTDFLLKCIQFPKYCAENMINGTPLF